MYRKSNLKIGLVLLIVLTVGFSVGYAYLNTTLTINGTSTVQKNTWDTHFDNIIIKEGSVTASVEPTIESSMKISNFQLMLEKPGDFYEFTVDVVNGGTLDAMVSNIIKTPDLTETQKKYLNYTITYENDEEIKLKQLVSVDSFVRIKVRVEYKKDIQPEDLPTELDLVNLGFEINYEQADESGISVKDNGVFRIVANGSLDDIGTIVTIGTEQFYTIGTEGENVKLLSMMNITLEDEPKQSSSASPTAFSSDEQKGINYSYYNGSIVEGYVNNYKNFLENKFNINIVEARLITREELMEKDTFDCVEYEMCSDKYPWIYSTSYWSGSVYSSTYIWYVYSNGYFGYGDYSVDFIYVCRPVIVMKKSDIVVDIKPVANGDINEIGTIVTIGSEQFYTIGTEGDNVKLLSMYNLYVGNECTSDSSSSCTLYGEEATGKQDSTMLGYVSGQTTRKGTTAFSSDTQKGINYSDYNGSIVEGYVNNYKSIIESEYGVDVVEARIITYDELTCEEIGCSAEDYICTGSAYPWIYSTSYWSGSAYNTGNVWLVSSFGDFLSLGYYRTDDYYGVRPVIIISKSNF